MAAKATKLETTMILKYKDGVDKNGKDVIKKQSFSKVKTSAADQDIFDVAKQFETLLGKTLNELVREDQSGITNA
ncbi:DUF1659 domain-containing protein [Clostridium scatologenes]|uniref:DUF1659 domain-containing protein n=1 Tax=Clostridium scatologenes TaxID=1548 RepID=A0A0E3JNI4_CLOSL|nr:DUF1659 domain-containing protein [Clostridium scatologenes]AKA69310.1 protein of unknown function DUF1659 [Clostridium scatologenes]